MENIKTELNPQDIGNRPLSVIPAVNEKAAIPGDSIVSPQGIDTGHLSVVIPANEKAVFPDDSNVNPQGMNNRPLGVIPAGNKTEEVPGESGIAAFKKVMRGYNPADVDDYIHTLNTNLEDATRVYEDQIADLKESMAFIARERDQLKNKLQTIPADLGAYEQKSAQLENALKELEELKARNTQLAEQAETMNPDFSENLLEENKQNITRIGEISAELKAAEEKIGESAAEIEMRKDAVTKLETEVVRLHNEYKEQEIEFAEYKAEKAKQANKISELNSANAKLANEVVKLRDVSAKQDSDFAKQKKEMEALFTKENIRLTGEINKNKNRITELEAELKSADQFMNKLVADISVLREENSKQAYDFAKQKKEIEMQNSIEHLNRSELLQVHGYNLQKSEDLLNEVLKQLSQAKDSLGQLNLQK